MKIQITATGSYEHTTDDPEFEADVRALEGQHCPLIPGIGQDIWNLLDCYTSDMSHDHYVIITAGDGEIIWEGDL